MSGFTRLTIHSVDNTFPFYCMFNKEISCKLNLTEEVSTETRLWFLVSIAR